MGDVITLPGDRVRTFRTEQGPGYGPAFDGFNPAPVSTVGNGRLYYGFSDRYEITVVVPDSGLARLIRRTAPLRPLGREAIDAWEGWQRRATEQNDPAGLPELERSLAEARYPDRTPAFDWFLVDAAGNLWVRHYTLPGSATATYSVFDESGAWITELDVPAVGPVGRPAVFDIGDDYVLIRQEDDVGIQYYARYDLIKPEG